MPKSAAAAEVVGQSSPTCEAKLFLGALGALRKSVTPTTKSVTHGRTLTAGDNTLSSLSVALPIMVREKLHGFGITANPGTRHCCAVRPIQYARHKVGVNSWSAAHSLILWQDLLNGARSSCVTLNVVLVNSEPVYT